jgi:hypothetical protein
MASTLWLGACAPGALGVVHALAVVASAAVAVFAAAMGTLAASDWRADVQYRQVWGGLRLTPTHISLTVEAAPAADIDPRYLVSATDEALREVFRTYRAAAQAAPSLPALTMSECVLRIVVPLPSQAARTVLSWKGRRCAKETARQLRLVANADVWPGWPGLTCQRAGTSADVIVLSGGKQGRVQPLPAASGGPGDRDSTAIIGCRGPPQTMARRTGLSAHPLVHDNLGQRIRVGQAELDVIESYLERELREPLAGVAPAGDRKDT